MNQQIDHSNININPDAEVCDRCDKETMDWLETKFFGEWLLLCSKCKQELEGEE